VTPFEDAVGDRLAFYVVPDEKSGFYSLEDDGSLVPTLIAMGTDVTEQSERRGVILASVRRCGGGSSPRTMLA
jgi:hypothetical protein